MLTDFVANGVHAPLWYGVDEGFYEDEGINLDIVYGTGSATTSQQVAAGQVHMGDAFSATFIQAVDSGAPLVAVGMYRADAGFAFFCDEELGLESIEDLSGHSIILPPGTVQASLYEGALRAASVEPDSVEPVAVEAKTSLSIYASGRADCIATTLGDAPTFQEIRPSDAFTWQEAGFNLAGFPFIVNNDFFESDKDLIERFLRATYKSISAALEEPDAALEAYLEHNPSADRDLTAKQWLDVSVKVFCTVDMVESEEVIGAQNSEAWDTTYEAVKEFQGLTGEDISVENLFTNEFVEDASISGTVCSPEMANM
ncbi:ABC transporter substrate-binding protein [Ornithinimicrobium sp. W1665]|uniref:ABC transporter substrate-binding protein n=1 Tax=Ornithinimicrobium sp. W1665 TaxID=3416666 RepID=UPI003CEAAC91